MAKKKKLTQRERQRIAQARWQLTVQREFAASHKRAIKAEEMRYKRLVAAVIACGKSISGHEKHFERHTKNTVKLKEKLQCLTATK